MKEEEGRPIPNLLKAIKYRLEVRKKMTGRK